ncbi:hypothetical protein AXG93_3415s1060 [Marchantia polymorpha subsp. ruderalis]|uniref:Uncharacterized protein n=1 Tax=Marchantia polymorpha subsp. ruderalis TaxID=1480154 RepID=A0A176WHB9_MARPO|nr:hypothetical protein AXG93_3415s1060 [Marchantia polymorpha subsp. ruderalis]
MDAKGGGKRERQRRGGSDEKEEEATEKLAPCRRWAASERGSKSALAILNSCSECEELEARNSELGTRRLSEHQVRRYMWHASGVSTVVVVVVIQRLPRKLTELGGDREPKRAAAGEGV